ncbi:carbon-nitrogen family hydrolase [Halorientalis halophila]|uniref:carbon-nitrogen family hydrolase n=1 Tax=Halorientalis halophila TaxID=3108499 RepID=UPI00300AF1D1
MRIASVQLEAGADAESNVAKGEARIRDAADSGADLVVLPEIWNLGYFAFDEYSAGAEPIDGPTMTHLQSLADELDIYLHTGSIVEENGDDLHNTSGLVSPEGELLDTYRKIHTYGYGSREQELLTPGERVVTVETDFGTVGLVTCYDLRFPELFRALVDQGAELFLVTSAWPIPRLEHWLMLNRMRAVENQVFLASSNLVGDNQGVELAGHSLVVDPWATPLANAGFHERTVIADVDMDMVAEARDDFPALADRQFDLSYDL